MSLSQDLGSNFFLTEEMVGKNRAASVESSVKELNDSVKLTCHVGELTEEIVSQHDCLVFVNQSRKNCIQWDKFCRKMKR